ncbi:hypothetical protein D3X11_00210 [Streptococcus sp. X16XC17]|uniref:hypothetical protein n=1 Tax=unclassified Streptococcus TaxID=2608887 RepID=UPI00066FDCC1|nr:MULTISPECIES: hypothetical protein [unclassified Streptococcus]TCD45950.1 hypothetical protein D3X11_00210 [Streptococcus sp. X16XC17]
MTLKIIHGIDFVEQINALEKKYNNVVTAKNFLDDNRSEFRRAILSISDERNSENYFAISESIKETERSLLIRCYTIAEQLLKETKYQLLGYDNLDRTDYQTVLEYKLEPNKFSPNPKFDEINKFFKRYHSNKLFLKKLELYDNMISDRHRYAHKGEFTFDISNVPKIKEVLLYLEFEYRMFLQKSSYCRLLKILNSVSSMKGNMQVKQASFTNNRIEICGLILEVIELLRNENCVIKDFSDVLSEISAEENFAIIQQKLENYRNSKQVLFMG